MSGAVEAHRARQPLPATTAVAAPPPAASGLLKVSKHSLVRVSPTLLTQLREKAGQAARAGSSVPFSSAGRSQDHAPQQHEPHHKLAAQAQWRVGTNLQGDRATKPQPNLPAQRVNTWTRQ